MGPLTWAETKSEPTLISIGVTTKPYPLFRLPGLHKYSIAYDSTGHRRYNQPFKPLVYGPAYVQGDVVGVGYRPRTGTIFFTRNGKKLEDIAHGLKTQNFFPTVGANGPCRVNVNFGQAGFVFIEANVKKWGLAPMTGSLAPPPPYGSEAGSILLEYGAMGVREGQDFLGHVRSSSAQMRLGRGPTSPGLVCSVVRRYRDRSSSALCSALQVSREFSVLVQPLPISQSVICHDTAFPASRRGNSQGSSR